MPPRFQKIRDCTNQNEPSDDHEYVGHNVVDRHVIPAPTAGVRATGAVYSIRIKIMTVGVRRLLVFRILAVRRGSYTAGAFHVKAVLHKGDAKARTRPILGGVGGVEKISEEKADELKGHGDHAVPDEGENGADGQAIDVDFVRTAHARGEDSRLPVGRCGVCGCLFVGLCLISINPSR